MSKIPATTPSQGQESPQPEGHEAPPPQGQDVRSAPGKDNTPPKGMAGQQTDEKTDAFQSIRPAAHASVNLDKNATEDLSPEDEMRQARQQLRDAQRQMEVAQQRLQEAHDRMDAQLVATRPDYISAKYEPDEHGAEYEQEESADEENIPAEPATALPPGNYGMLNGLFAGFANIAPIALLVILACMCWPTFLAPDKSLYCPGEVTTLSSVIHCIAANNWFTPMGLDNGALTQAQWPVFTAAFGLLSLIPGLVDMGLLLPLTTFCGTFLAVFGVWCLGMAAGFGARASFAAGLILLCAPIFAPLPDFVGPASLAAGLLMLALAFFCHGWRANHAWISLPVAFVLTALAGLCGGLLHFATPLIASLLFLIWQGRLRRAQRLDAILGFVLMLAVLGVWLGMMMQYNHEAYMASLIDGAFRFEMPFPLIWLLPIAAGIIGLLPWLLIIFGVSWFRVLGQSARTLGASRRDNGSAIVWLSLVIAIIISICIPAFHPSAIAIACLAAVLLGKAFVNLRSGGNRFFFLLASLLLICAGVLMNAVTYPESQQLIFSSLPVKLPVADLPQLLIGLKGLQIMGYICILGGLIGFFFVRRFKAAGGLIFGAIVMLALCQAARLMFVPEMAAHAGTPLVTYTAIEKRVKDAMTGTPKTPAPDAAQAPATPQKPAAPVAPASETSAPAEAAPAEAPAAAEVPEAQPAQSQNAAPETAAPAAEATASEAKAPAEANAPAETAPAETNAKAEANTPAETNAPVEPKAERPAAETPSQP